METEKNKKLLRDDIVAIAIGRSRHELSWKNKELKWSELVKKLSEPTKTRESMSEYKSLPKAKRDEIKDVGGFVGGCLKEGRRKADNVAWRSILTLDLDHLKKNENPWDDVLNLGCSAAMYSTHSHTPESPRLRIVIPLSRRVNADEYAALARRVAADIGIDRCDDTTFEPHRLMYWPSISSDAEYIFATSESAYWLNVDEQLARYDDWRDPAEWAQSSRKTETLKKMADKQGDPLTKTGVVGLFCRTYSIEDAIDEYLSDVYTKGAGDRYTYAQGSTAGGLVIYDDGKFAYSHHGTDPCSGLLCNAFDLVRIHKFRERDIDTPDDESPSKRPSYKAMLELADNDTNIKQQALEELRGAFDDTPEDEGVDNSWREKIEMYRGKPKATINNLVLILENDSRLKGKYAYDEFMDRPIVLGDLPWRKLRDRISCVWSDTDDAGLRNYIEALYQIDNVAKTKDALDIALLNNSFHPVRDYLESLTWDGRERADSLLIDYMGAEDSLYTREATRKALLGAVARILEPGCKHDHMLVLVGPQGCGKSTLLNMLGGKWFSDSLYTVTGKEAYEQLQGYWIIEMGEMAAARKAELEQIKQFISKKTDIYRAVYARRTQERPRQCAFFGSTNDIEFLHDQSGNRRFWPITVTWGDRELDFDVDQIWAEIVDAYNLGEVWHLDRELEKEAVERQRAHTEVSSKQGMIEEFLKIKLPENWDELSISERQAYFYEDSFDEKAEGVLERDRICAIVIWVELFNGDPKRYNLRDAREINGILRQIEGWKERDKISFGKQYGRQRGFEKVT